MKRNFQTVALFLMLPALSLFQSSCKEEIKSCQTGFEGSSCQTLSRSKFIGQWSGTENCTATTADYTVTISSNATNELSVNFVNLNNKDYVAVGKIVNENEIQFSGTGMGTGGGKIDFSGNILYSDNTEDDVQTIKVTYLISSSVANTGCTYIATKKL